MCVATVLTGVTAAAARFCQRRLNFDPSGGAWVLRHGVIFQTAATPAPGWCSAVTQGPRFAAIRSGVAHHTTESRSLVRAAAVAFDRVRQHGLSHAQSRDLILKVAEEKWNV
jgi:hypothetical protein